MFDCANMQSSVIDSLTEFVRMYSVSTRSGDRRSQAKNILKDMLGGARQHRQTVNDFKTSSAALTQSDWLTIIGVGEKTRVQLIVDRDRRGPWFIIDESQFVNELDGENQRSQRTGDGTVPLPGALPPFIATSKVVCVTEDDLGALELRDRLMVNLGGFHGLLPRINLVQRLVTKHLQPAYRGRVWGRRLPGSRSWNPPLPGLAEKDY